MCVPKLTEHLCTYPPCSPSHHDPEKNNSPESRPSESTACLLSQMTDCSLYGKWVKTHLTGRDEKAFFFFHSCHFSLSNTGVTNHINNWVHSTWRCSSAKAFQAGPHLNGMGSLSILLVMPELFLLRQISAMIPTTGKMNNLHDAVC